MPLLMRGFDLAGYALHSGVRDVEGVFTKRSAIGEPILAYKALDSQLGMSDAFHMAPVSTGKGDRPPENRIMRSLLGWPFAQTAGLALATTGLAKAFSAIGPARALDTPDPLTGIPFRQLLLLVGLAELLIAFFCLFTDKRRFSLLAVAWLSTNFLVYRLGLWFIGWHHPCACMGSLAGALHLSDQAADNIMKGVLAYLLIGSYLLLAWQWRQSRPSAGDDARSRNAQNAISA